MKKKEINSGVRTKKIANETNMNKRSFFGFLKASWTYILRCIKKILFLDINSGFRIYSPKNDTFEH